MDHAITCYLELPGGQRVEVGITVLEEPLIPTPSEPEVQRAPALHEWADICHRLATHQMTISKAEASESPDHD
jgi:hypothetical protein